VELSTINVANLPSNQILFPSKFNIDETSAVFGDNSKDISGASEKLPTKSIGDPSSFSLHLGSCQSFPFDP
tara:strand:- start:174 stop:386 length:213 start_codon:yes stop_codon:yes gene_type:complete